ncbi:inorganic triphosphatase YgiF [Cricetibacter osteomyelitidis]|uniref:Inorganic triphosphatase YgiF n=1 Tax=Cricetibacter osteomyelitidis TaxID=1521931 RepID=A0A4R2T4R9_9PAST|nr:CYTH domain-containing protein [Cricetibacter osteomyelitidis]TCP95824.1 inorganic triphosphatase YgiF [Cricetibacter osteomyelitidis]
MSNEIELKLSVDQAFADFLSRQLSEYRVLSEKQTALGNYYYDTEQQFFAKHKMGLRVRTEDGQCTMTLKTDGKVTGGLHIRPEYNAALETSEPQLDKLTDFLHQELGADFALPNTPLRPIFSTDFNRTLWIVKFGNGAEIEVALDQGEIKAGDKQQAVSEVEFEIKQGQVSDLLTFVDGLTLTDGVRLSSVSKAKRGYLLADNGLIKPIEWLEKWKNVLDLEQNAVNPSEILTALFQHEQQLIEETVQFGADYFAQDFLRTVERIGAFFNLYHYYSENGRLLTATLTEQQEKGNDQADEQTVQELVDSNARLLDHIKDIIRLHSESKNNQLAMEKLIEILHLGRYINRLIGLIRMTIK